MLKSMTESAAPQRNGATDMKSSSADFTWDLKVKDAGFVVKVLKPPRVLDARSSQVRTIAFSPDGKSLASGSQDGTIILSTVPPTVEKLEFRQILCHDDAIESVAFSPDGKVLVSGGWDHRVKLWEISERDGLIKLRWSWEGTSDGARPVAFSPDGKNVAIGSFDGFLTVLDAVNGNTAWATAKPATPVNGVCFSPDGSVVALALGTEFNNDPLTRLTGEVQIWDSRAHALRARIDGEQIARRSIAFSPDGKLLAITGVNGTTWLPDTETYRVNAILPSETFVVLDAVGFRGDGKILATGDRAGDVCLWDPVNRRRFATIKRAHKNVISALSFSPDGSILATASWDGTIKLWNVSEPADR